MVEHSSTAGRPGTGGLRLRLRDFWFAIDLRSVGLFRILLGLVLLAHWVIRWRWLGVLYTAGGVLPATAQEEIREVAVRQDGTWPALGWWTPLEWLDSLNILGYDFGPWALRGFLLAVLVCYLMFAIGYRTRLFALLSFLATAAIAHRNPYALIGADFVIGSLLLWAQFLPLGARFSVDALRGAVARGVALPKERSTADESRVPGERLSAFSIAAFGVVLQIGLIYFFTGLWKTVPMLWGESAAWRDGTAIHYVLHMEQSIYWPALWARELPLWCIRFLSYGTLAIELAALPMFLLPWLQPLLRRVAIVSLILLHAGIAVTLDAGLFSYVMVASYALLLTSADWTLLRRLLAPFSRPATIYYDDGCGVCTRTCEILAACDRFGRLSFIGNSDREAYRHTIPGESGPHAPRDGLVTQSVKTTLEELTEKTVVVFDDRTGRMYVRSRGMAAALRGLPLPYRPLSWFALPGLHRISDLGYDAFARNRHRVSRWLGLTACRLPGGGKLPRREHPQSQQRVAGSSNTGATLEGSSWLLNSAASVVLACVVAANLLENVGGLAQLWRQHEANIRAAAADEATNAQDEPSGYLGLLEGFVKLNERANLIVNFSAAIQRWNMFAPDPPRLDEWWVAEAELEDGRQRIDPLAGSRPTDFVTQPSFREARYERIWGTYLQHAPGETRPERFAMAQTLRREFCRYLVDEYNRGAAAGQRIASLDLYQIRAAMPTPALDAKQLAALWPADNSQVERTIAPRRAGFNPYRWGLLIASYDPRKARPLESAGDGRGRALRLDDGRGDRSLVRRINWFPSGSRCGDGPYDLVGDASEGQWTEWLANGLWQEGPYRHGLKHGLWRVHHPEGGLHSKGKFERGRREGTWSYYYAHGGLKEEIAYVADRREGPYARRHENGAIMERGQFHEDQADGVWTYWDPAGFRAQEGPLERGQRHGDWTFWQRSGRRDRLEHYENGVQQGPFTEFHADGETVGQQGEMRDGQPHGEWKKFFANGQIAEEGEYADGLRTGLWKSYCEMPSDKPAQVQKEETYAAGKLEGPFVEYYESGAVKQRWQYTANLRQGPCIAWHPNGKEERRGELKDDVEQGPWTFWHENGQKQREGSFEHGQQQGEWKLYYDNGQVLTAGLFVAGAPHGCWTSYHKNGKLSQRGEFAAGKQTGRWEIWAEDGSKSSEGDYAEGKKVGLWKTWVKGQETQQTYQDDVLIDAPAQAPRDALP